jgi:murein peptide amidase A
MRRLLMILAGAAILALSAAGPGSTVIEHSADRHVTIGRSVQGRPIEAIETGDPASRVKVVVVGCIHGDEPAGIAIANILAARGAPPGVDLWVVPDMNPDGVAAHTRENARGVDLNRNFPWDWHKPARQAWAYTPHGPLSEPESRAMYRLFLRLKPKLVIWYHQALGVVDESGGSIGLERFYSNLVHLPLKRLTRYPGSGTSWVDHHFPGSTSFVVELPPRVKPKISFLNADAVDRLAASLG